MPVTSGSWYCAVLVLPLLFGCALVIWCACVIWLGTCYLFAIHVGLTTCLPLSEAGLLFFTACSIVLCYPVTCCGVVHVIGGQVLLLVARRLLLVVCCYCYY